MRTAAAAFGQLYLTLAFGIACAIRFRLHIMAMRTGNACVIMRRTEVFRRQRPTVGTTEHGLTLGNAMRHRDPLIEDETFAFPEAFSGGYRFKIFEYPALEMKHLFNAEGFHKSRCLFAADAPGAEHCHLAAAQL